MSFTYDDSGIRTSKTVNNVTHTYQLNGSQIVSEQWEDKLIVYLYDAAGSPIGMMYRTTSYAEDAFDVFWFEKNLEGDVVAIYSSYGIKVATYTYNDAWGNHTVSYSNGGVSSGAYYNPFRYRGYYYDTDLGMYYLQSRYYDPNTCRFINADALSYLGANGDLISYNLYSYCNNNPVNKLDTSGHFGLSLGIVAACAIGGGLMGAFSAVTTGGNVAENIFEGVVTGVVSATLGLTIRKASVAIAIATCAGFAIDLAFQTSNPKNGDTNDDSSKIDWGRAIRMGIQTGLGTAIPSLGAAAANFADAVGTALIWIEGSAIIVIADVIITNLFSQ